MFKKIIKNLNDKYIDFLKKNHILKSVGVEITGRCNLQCKHCYMNSFQEKSDVELSTKEWLDFFKKLKKDFGKNILIQITGGEPFFREDIFDILDFLKKEGFAVSLVTNGVLLDNEKLIKIKKNSIDLAVSLDGLKDAHNFLRQANVFDKTLENIRLFKKNQKGYLTIKTVVFKNNLKDLDQLYKILTEIEVDVWHLIAMEPIGRGKDCFTSGLSMREYLKLCVFIDKINSFKNNKIKIIFEEMNTNKNIKTLEIRKNNFCFAGITSCAILHNGSVVVCIQNEREKILGNIKKDSFFDIWQKGSFSQRKECCYFCKNHYFLNQLYK